MDIIWAKTMYLVLSQVIVKDPNLRYCFQNANKSRSRITITLYSIPGNHGVSFIRTPHLFSKKVLFISRTLWYVWPAGSYYKQSQYTDVFLNYTFGMMQNT